MNGYSKISSGPAHKPRSIDFPDSISFPQTPKGEEEREVKKNSKTENCLSEAGEGGERFGMILGRSCSVSSSSSSGYGFQATMKRAFSMRRSSSVSERYCRIHDQYMAIASPIGDDVEATGSMKMKMKTKKNKNRGVGGNKILKVCKRMFGL